MMNRVYALISLAGGAVLFPILALGAPMFMTGNPQTEAMLDDYLDQLRTDWRRLVRGE